MLKDCRYKNGQKLRAVLGPMHFIDYGDGNIVEEGFSASIDSPHIEAIEVVMEKGQCGLVPWALVKYASDGHYEKFNLALMAVVVLIPEVTND